MHKKDSLVVRMCQVFGFGKSISRVDAKFRRCASILLIVVIACIITLCVLAFSSVMTLITLLYEQRVNVVIFILLLFLIMQLLKIIYALAFNITSLKNTWGIVQELMYLNDWQRTLRIIIWLISIAALVTLFISKSIQEFMGVDSLGAAPSISAIAVIIALILLLSSLKEILMSIVEFRAMKQKEFPYRVTKLHESELYNLKAPLNDKTSDWCMVKQGRLTYHSNSINKVLFDSSINPTTIHAKIIN
jgi:hypothetical protein